MPLHDHSQAHCRAGLLTAVSVTSLAALSAVLMLPATATAAPRSAPGLGAGPVDRLAAGAGHTFARTKGIGGASSPASAARAFVRDHAAQLGTTDLGRARIETTEVGRVVRLTQTVRGLPVLGGSVTVSMTGDNRVRSALRRETSAVDRALPTVTTSAGTAARTAVSVSRQATGVDDLIASAPRQVFYDPSLLGVPGSAPARAVWSVEVTSPARLDVRRRVLVDVVGGGVALQWSEVEQARARVICNDNDRVLDFSCPSKDSPVVASEASPPAAGADADVTAAFTTIGGVYDFYAQVLGRDGVDGHGGAVAATVRACDSADDCPMDNAFWDGDELVLGTGFASADDVVAHEITHGVTDATSGLFYLYQSGAIDESMSDVLGELEDQWNGTGRDSDGAGGTVDYRWMLGEDLPASQGVLRDMRTPTVAPAGVSTANFVAQPDSMVSPLYRAAVDSKTGVPVDSGEVHLNSGVGNKAAELIVDGGRLNGVTVTGLGGASPATRLAAVAKAAHLYYLTDQLLASGSDYADLAGTLSQSCDELVGRSLPDGKGGSVTMTATDCASVREAVAATRMTSNPARASAPDAPVCSAGTPVSYGFRDNFENPASRLWKTGAGWYNPQTRARTSDRLSYATSGSNELYASDGESSRDSAATMLKTYAVPVGKSSYLRFAQAWLLDYEPAGDGEPALYFDGGRVEYSANGGPWRSAASLFDNGGYNQQITGYTADKQAYTFRGFGGDSHGYRSSRLNLTPLAGSTIRVRFRLTTDSFGSSYGWFIDDVAFYGCGARPSAVKASVVRGTSTAQLRWSTPADRGTSALTRYTVAVTDLTAHRTMVSIGVKANVHTLRTVVLKGHHYRWTVTAWNKAGRGPAATVSG